MDVLTLTAQIIAVILVAVGWVLIDDFGLQLFLLGAVSLFLTYLIELRRRT